jgi:hypothetical protein
MKLTGTMTSALALCLATLALALSAASSDRELLRHIVAVGGVANSTAYVAMDVALQTPTLDRRANRTDLEIAIVGFEDLQRARLLKLHTGTHESERESTPAASAMYATGAAAPPRYGLRFSRSHVLGNDGTPLPPRGGSIEVGLAPSDGRGASTDGLGGTLSMWTLPDDPASLAARAATQLVLLDKSHAASTQQSACPGVEYRVSLEATTDRSGSSLVLPVDATTLHYELRVDIDVQTLGDGTPTGGHQWQTGVVVPHGVWTFIAVSWDSTSVSVFVNGSLAVRRHRPHRRAVTVVSSMPTAVSESMCVHAVRASVQVTAPRVGVSSDSEPPSSCELGSVLLGARRHRDGVRDFFSGMMDRVSIWRRALSTTEVAQWYASEPVGVEAGLVAFVAMDERRGAYVNSAMQSADASGAAVVVPLQGVVRLSESRPGGECECVRVFARLMLMLALLQHVGAPIVFDGFQ